MGSLACKHVIVCKISCSPIGVFWNKISCFVLSWLAQWLEHWTGDLKVEGSNLFRSTKKRWSCSELNRLCWLAVIVPQPPCIHRHAKAMCEPERSCGPCQSLVDYGNTKITTMHLHPQRQNVAAQVAEELKTVTYATAPMEERRKESIEQLLTGCPYVCRHEFGERW